MAPVKGDGQEGKTAFDGDIEELLDAAGIAVRPLGRATTRAQAQLWRQTFLALVPRDERRRASGTEWGFLSTRRMHAFEREEAYSAYRDQPDRVFFVLVEGFSSGYRCSGRPLPDLNNSATDYYVFPKDMSWTMVFTHEQDWGAGPYFCTKEMAASSPPPRPRRKRLRKRRGSRR